MFRTKKCARNDKNRNTVDTTRHTEQQTIAQMASTQRTNAQGIHTQMTIAPHENEMHKPKTHNKTHTCAHVPPQNNPGEGERERERETGGRDGTCGSCAATPDPAQPRAVPCKAGPRSCAIPCGFTRGKPRSRASRAGQTQIACNPVRPKCGKPRSRNPRVLQRKPQIPVKSEDVANCLNQPRPDTLVCPMSVLQRLETVEESRGLLVFQPKMFSARQESTICDSLVSQVSDLLTIVLAQHPLGQAHRKSARAKHTRDHFGSTSFRTRPTENTRDQFGPETILAQHPLE